MMFNDVRCMVAGQKVHILNEWWKFLWYGLRTNY